MNESPRKNRVVWHDKSELVTPYDSDAVKIRKTKLDIMRSRAELSQPDVFHTELRWSEKVTKVDKKYSEMIFCVANKDDRYSQDMEPVLRQILEYQTVFPSVKNFAFMGSDRDDKIHGTDIVFGIEDKKTKERTVFSIDATTATDKNEIMGKLNESFDGYSGVAQIDDCQLEDARWSEPEALHFVLGMSPASQEKAVDRFKLNNGSIYGREADLASDFIVLSEFWEQIALHEVVLGQKPETESKVKLAKSLEALKGATRSGLVRALGFGMNDEPPTEEAFEKAYADKKSAMRADDAVYNNICFGAQVKKARLRGQKIVDVTKKSGK